MLTTDDSGFLRDLLTKDLSFDESTGDTLKRGL